MGLVKDLHGDVIHGPLIDLQEMSFLLLRFVVHRGLVAAAHVTGRAEAPPKRTPGRTRHHSSRSKVKHS